MTLISISLNENVLVKCQYEFWQFFLSINDGSDVYDDEKPDIQVIVLTECEGGGRFSTVRKSKIKGEVFGESTCHPTYLFVINILGSLILSDPGVPWVQSMGTDVIE